MRFLIRQLVELLRSFRELLRLDDADAGLAGDEARVLEQRAVEADERPRPLDVELAERAQHPPARVLPVAAVDDQLGDHRVVERQRSPTRRATPESTRTPGPAGSR